MDPAAGGKADAVGVPRGAMRPLLFGSGGPADPAAAETQDAAVAGVLRSHAGNVLIAYWKRGPGIDLSFSDPPAAGSYQADIPWGPGSAKTNLAVTVTASDIVLWH